MCYYKKTINNSMVQWGLTWSEFIVTTPKFSNDSMTWSVLFLAYPLYASAKHLNVLKTEKTLDDWHFISLQLNFYNLVPVIIYIIASSYKLSFPPHSPASLFIFL